MSLFNVGPLYRTSLRIAFYCGFCESAESVVSNLGLSGTSLVYRWKAKFLQASGPAAGKLETRIAELEEELRRVERERDILKKALAIFSQKT